MHNKGAVSSHQIVLWLEDVKPHEIHRTRHQYGDACTGKRRELAFFSLLITHHHRVAASLDTIQKWDSRSYSILYTALLLLPLIMYSGYWRTLCEDDDLRDYKVEAAMHFWLKTQPKKFFDVMMKLVQQCEQCIKKSLIELHIKIFHLLLLFEAPLYMGRPNFLIKIHVCIFVK